MCAKLILIFKERAIMVKRLREMEIKWDAGLGMNVDGWYKCGQLSIVLRTMIMICPRGGNMQSGACVKVSCWKWMDVYVTYIRNQHERESPTGKRLNLVPNVANSHQITWCYHFLYWHMWATRDVHKRGNIICIN